MKDVLFYCHKGSGNHGCEAIIRGTMNVLDNAGEFKYTLVSEDPSQDIKYGIGEKVNVVKEQNGVKKGSLKFLNAYLDKGLSLDKIFSTWYALTISFIFLTAPATPSSSFSLVIFFTNC